MTLSVETLLVVSLLMAVFAAVSTVGTSLFLGAGYERLRNGFENIRKQTAFFSDAIHKLDGRVEGIEKQSTYFFEAISELEQKVDAPVPHDAPVIEAAREEVQEDIDVPSLLSATKDDVLHTQTDNLLTANGFIESSPSFH
ncbi:MAG: hypothetical protein H6867_06260 [Rhodospirillales bacterium]|nr:hypothetical protein [Rhodospirillales bacterium]MCB9995134.1 hypothetical protein [Rhodospirillales bacterium]